MLVLLIRVVFAAAATAVGWAHGAYFIHSELPDWAGAVTGFAIAVTLIAGEQAFRARFTRSLVAFMLGLAGGLALSLLIIAVLHVAIANDEAVTQVRLPVALLITYLVVILVVQNADRLRLIVPFVEFQAGSSRSSRAVAAPDVLADSRLRGLSASGLIGELVMHGSALQAWERGLDAADAVEQARARRALAMIAELRTQPEMLSVDASELPGARDAAEACIRLARLLSLRVVTADADMAERCRAEGLGVIHLAALAAALSPTVKPGDRLRLLIARPGDGKGQGIGHLDDGSMVVVGGAADAVGQSIEVQVQRLHQTGNGRMVFAERV